MQDDEKGNMQMQATCYLRGLPPPQAGLLTGCWVVPTVPVERLSFLMLLSKHLHGSFVVCLLLRMMSCGVFNMLAESSMGLLRPFINVANSDVEVAQP